MIKDSGFLGKAFSGIGGLFRRKPGPFGLMAASALGAGGVLGGRKVFGMMTKKDVAKAMVELAVKANPMYATMDSIELQKAAAQLEMSFNADPILYAQALDIYKAAKESGRI